MRRYHAAEKNRKPYFYVLGTVILASLGAAASSSEKTRAFKGVSVESVISNNLGTETNYFLKLEGYEPLVFYEGRQVKQGTTIDVLLKEERLFFKKTAEILRLEESN